jgi:hypothetical protein
MMNSSDNIVLPLPPLDAADFDDDASNQAPVLPDNHPVNTTAAVPTNPFADPSFYIDDREFFELIQDTGVPMNEKEKSTWKQNPKKKKNKHITVVPFHYPKLYMLSEKLFKLYSEKKEQGVAFQKLSTNKSNVCHALGTFLASSRYYKLRSSVLAETEGVQASFANDAQYNNTDHLYFLNQSDVLKVFYNNNTTNVSDLLKTQQCDQVRAMLILFTDDMREYIDVCMKKGDKSNRQVLDGWESKKRAFYVVLLQKFIDAEVHVELPKKWFADNTKETINMKYGPDAWNSYNDLLNPNKPDRISLPFTTDHMKSMVDMTILEYNRVMVDYQKNTGGGDGNEEAFTTWDCREDLTFLNYDHKVKDNVYLTIIHMLDKEYQFPLTVVNDTLSEEAMIDDFKTPSAKTIRTTSTNSAFSIRSSFDSSDQHRSNDERNEMIRSLKNAADAMISSSNDVTSDMVENINKTADSIERFNSQLNDLKDQLKKIRKRMLLSDENTKKKLRKKEEHIHLDMKTAKDMVKTLKVTLTNQKDSLKKMNGLKSNEGEHSDSYDEYDAYDSDDDNSDV